MTYTLTGRYPTGDLEGRAGRLRFTPSTTIVGADNIILPAPVEVDLDSDGAFSVALVGTDDADYAPSGWVWTVAELLQGGRPAWSFELTADGDISDLTAVAVPDAYSIYVEIGDELTASLSSGAATAGQVPAADGAGGIDWADQSGGGAALSDALPADLGTAAAGVGTAASRDDHVHDMPTAADVGAAATSHTHALTDVTDAGGAAALDVGTTAGTVAAGDHGHALGDLSDVSTAGATAGQSLVSDGTNWAPGTVSGGVSRPMPSASNQVMLSSKTADPYFTSLTTVSGRLYFIPMEIPSAFSITGLVVEVKTAAASSTARLGLYTDSGGVPDSLIVDVGTVDTSATGTKTGAVASTAVPAGLVWCAIQVDGGTPALAAAPGGAHLQVPRASAFGNWTTHHYRASTGTDLPASPGALSAGFNNPIAMGLVSA